MTETYLGAGNGIGEVGLRMLNDALKVNTSLTKLSLAGKELHT